MWRGRTNVVAILLALAGPAVTAASDPFAYRFDRVPGPEDWVKPQPEIDARYSPRYHTCHSAPGATTYSIDICDAAEMALQDAALNKQWAWTLAAISAGRVPALRVAERAWIRWRSARCDAEAQQYAGGTIMPLIYGGCMIDETIRRTLWLEKLR